MWRSGNYNCSTVSERETGTTSTSNYVSGIVEIEEVSSTKNTNEVVGKKLRRDQMYGDKLKKPDDAIRNAISKWQLRNRAKCAHENAVNMVLYSMSVNFCSTEEHSLNSASHDIVLENEAVLTAIERKGLRQHESSVSEEDDRPHNNRCNVSAMKKYLSPSFHSTQNDYVIENVDHPTWSNEIQENNFEMKFMTEAVSTAIEVKGLTLMHPV